MKTFSFRLEQVLRWRETQVNLQKSRVATASARVAEIDAAIGMRKSELSRAAEGTAEAPTGALLAAYAEFREKSLARIRDLEGKVIPARRVVAAEMEDLIEANRRVRLLENLKRNGQIRWRAEFDRELAAFADEVSLGRIQSERRRARSSGG